MKNLEHIDDYLANRLKGNERDAFERELANNSELRSQLEWQKQIVEGIKHARAAELKSMLSKVPVTGGGAQIQFSVMRIAAGVVLAGVVSAAAYYYISGNDFPPIENAAADVTKTEAVKPEATKEEPAAPQQQSTEPQATPEEEKQQSKSNKAAEEIKPATKPSLNVADPSSELTDENPTSEELPPATNNREIAPAHVQVEMDSSNKKYDFHYQFAGSKLMLYGSFDRGLYEVLEINSAQHGLFLYYKNNFYLLDEAQQKITKLSPIEDKALLQKLREYRSR